METQYQVRVIMSCILEEWRMESGAVEGREVFCLLGNDTIMYFETQLVSFQRNNLFPFSRWSHVYLRDTGSVFL